MQYGATCFALVYPQCIGRILRQLEFAPEVFLLEREADPDRGGEVWKLRSDEFPSVWEGCAVQIVSSLKDERPEIELLRR